MQLRDPLTRALPWVCGAALVALSVSGLFAHPDLPDGHDLWPHAVNTVEYARCFADGVWWPQWLPDLSGGYGGPNPLYYNPLPHHVSGRLMQAGLSLPLALKTAATIAMALSFAGMYLWGAAVWGRAGGLLAAAVYLLAPYHLCDLYIRFAYPELMGLAVAPWVFWLAQRDVDAGGRTRGTAAGLALLMLAHNLSAVLFGGLLFGFVAAQALRPGRARAAAFAMRTFPLAIGFSAFFWIPIAFEAQLTRLPIDDSVKYTWRDHLHPPARLFDQHWPGNRQDLPLYPGRLPIGLGALAALTALALALRGDGRARAHAAFAAVVLAHVALTLEPARPLWERTPLPVLQFPWRFLGPITLGLAFLAPLALTPLRVHRGLHALACAALVLVVAHDGAVRCAPDGHREIQLTAGQLRHRIDTGDSDCHFMPAGAHDPPVCALPTLAIAGGYGTLRVLESAPQSHRARVEATRPVVLDVRIYDFEGWRATIDGRPAPLEREEGLGAMRLAVPAGAHEVRVWFGWTAFRASALAITLATLAILIAPQRPRRRAAGRALAAAGWIALAIGLYGVVDPLSRRIPARGPDHHAHRARVAMRFRDHASAMAELAKIDGGPHAAWAARELALLRDHGALGTWYDEPSMKAPKLARREWLLALDTVSNPFCFPGAFARITAVLDVPAAGVHAFALECDDDGRLFLDGREVVSGGDPWNLYRVEGVADLAAGPHELAIVYKSESARGTLRAWWRPPGGAWTIIPTGRMKPATFPWVAGLKVAR